MSINIDFPQYVELPPLPGSPTQPAAVITTCGPVLCAVCGKAAHPWACEGAPDPWRDGFRNGIERGIVIASHQVPAPDGPRPRFADEIVHALGRELGWA